MSKQKSDSIQPTQVESLRTSRRKLTAAALASPVILGTLVSKQALGDVLYDCTISGKLSNNQSSHGGVDDCSIGKSHGYWKNTPDDWDYGFSQTDPFTKFLSGIGQFSNQYPKADGSSKSFGEVLDLGGGAGSPYPALGREAVCALLNALKYGLNFPLTPQQVVTIFNTTVSAGQYIPQVGAKPWSPEVVKNYFESLHDS